MVIDVELDDVQLDDVELQDIASKLYSVAHLIAYCTMYACRHKLCMRAKVADESKGRR